MRPVLLGTLTLIACQSGDTDQAQGRSGGDGRVFDPAAFDTLWSLGEHADSSFSYLWSPQSAPGGGLYVADIGNAQLHHVNATGELVWSYGRRGQGPGELMEARVISVDPRGNAVIIDNLNRRIVTVGRDGGLLGEHPLPKEVGHASAVAALDDGNFAIAHFTGPWTLMSKDGGFLQHIEPPWEGFADKPFLEVVGQAIPVRGSNRWVYSFDAAGEWIVFDGAEILGRYAHIEHVPFPEMLITRTENGGTMVSYEGSAPITTADLAVRRDTLFVLYHGTTEYSGRVMDKYDIDTGDYLGSVLFPSRTTGVALGDDGIVYAVSDSPLFPTVAALRSISDVP